MTEAGHEKGKAAVQPGEMPVVLQVALVIPPAVFTSITIDPRAVPLVVPVLKAKPAAVVKVKVPVTVYVVASLTAIGVPEIAPVVAFKVKPVGNVGETE